MQVDGVALAQRERHLEQRIARRIARHAQRVHQPSRTGRPGARASRATPFACPREQIRGRRSPRTDRRGTRACWRSTRSTSASSGGRGRRPACRSRDPRRRTGATMSAANAARNVTNGDAPRARPIAFSARPCRRGEPRRHDVAAKALCRRPAEIGGQRERRQVGEARLPVGERVQRAGCSCTPVPARPRSRRSRRQRRHRPARVRRVAAHTPRRARSAGSPPTARRRGCDARRAAARSAAVPARTASSARGRRREIERPCRVLARQMRDPLILVIGRAGQPRRPRDRRADRRR